MMVSLTSIIFMVAITLLGLNGQWTRLTRQQISLDRCVGKEALALKKNIHQIEFLNSRINELRALMLAAPTPAILTTLRTALHGVFIAQEAALLKWRLKAIHWLSPTFCSSTLSAALPYPTLFYRRPPADVLGPKALLHPAPSTPKLKLSRSTQNRKSGALVWQSTQSPALNSDKETWNARWYDENPLPFRWTGTL